MKAYKVVSAGKAKLTSYALHDKKGVGIDYEPGAWAKPLLKNSMLFVFKHLIDAKALTQGDSMYEIWECETKAIFKMPVCLMYFESSERFAKFWRLKMYYIALFTLASMFQPAVRYIMRRDYLYPSPRGTYITKAVKLTRRIC